MAYRKHRHSWRLERRWHYPDGYLFKCRRCVKENLDPFRFVRYGAFWD